MINAKFKCLKLYLIESIAYKRFLTGLEPHITQIPLARDLEVIITGVSKLKREMQPQVKFKNSTVRQHITHKFACQTLFLYRSDAHLAQKNARIDWSIEMLTKYNSDALKDDYDIVKGDESWRYAHELDTK